MEASDGNNETPEFGNQQSFDMETPIGIGNAAVTPLRSNTSARDPEIGMDVEANAAIPELEGSLQDLTDDDDASRILEVPLTSLSQLSASSGGGSGSGGGSDQQRVVSFGDLARADRGMVQTITMLTGEGTDDGSANASLISNASDGMLAPGAGHGHVQQSVRFLPEKKGRMSLVADLETGKAGVRGHRAVVRENSSCVPQSPSTRRRKGLNRLGKKLVNPFWGIEETEEEEPERNSEGHVSVNRRFKVDHFEVNDDEHIRESQRELKQYRLQAIDPNEGKFSPFGLPTNLGIYEEAPSSRKGCKCCGCHPNKSVISYLNWAFRSSFIAVALSAACAFFSLTIFFAVIILFIGLNKEDCVHVNGVDFGTDEGDKFLDAYALSWTTFSTVGYGLVFPATSATSEGVRSCTGITVLATLESFVGILFASLWGAIFFAKVTRVASVAQVEFSDAIVIKYGAGLASADDDSSSSEEGSKAGSADDDEQVVPESEKFEFVPSKIPCPLLEFRVLNLRSAQHGGEIIDASMNIVASIDESQASQALRNSAKGPRRRGKKGKRRGGRRGGGGRAVKNGEVIVATREQVARAQETLNNLLSANRANQKMEEDPTGKFIPNKIFAKLEIESQEHPFFKRVWLARHVLDQHSPLLKQEAKELIRLNGGNWPKEMNDAESVRASVSFDQILVSLSGTSNADANSVYAQNVYDYVDLCVGYRFCDILYREADGSIGVDRTLLNDVNEQRGGGGEDLHARAKNELHDIFIL